jgi:hypothetical protein
LRDGKTWLGVLDEVRTAAVASPGLLLRPENRLWRRVLLRVGDARLVEPDLRSDRRTIRRFEGNTAHAARHGSLAVLEPVAGLPVNPEAVLFDLVMDEGGVEPIDVRIEVVYQVWASGQYNAPKRIVRVEAEVRAPLDVGFHPK